jgi:hypothetical protein
MAVATSPSYVAPHMARERTFSSQFSSNSSNPGSGMPLSASADTLPSPSSPSPTPSHPSKLVREKNRLTLRSYLHSLMSSKTFASSPVLKCFLLSTPIVLNKGEREDAQRREEADRVRDEGRRQFAREVAGSVEALREAVKSVKGDLMGKGRLSQTVRKTASWGLMWVRLCQMG